MELKSLGRYRILDELGRGAMGTVYRAVDPLIEREVAIKALRAPIRRPGLTDATTQVLTQPWNAEDGGASAVPGTGPAGAELFADLEEFER